MYSKNAYSGKKPQQDMVSSLREIKQRLKKVAIMFNQKQENKKQDSPKKQISKRKKSKQTVWDRLTPSSLNKSQRIYPTDDSLNNSIKYTNSKNDIWNKLYNQYYKQKRKRENLQQKGIMKEFSKCTFQPNKSYERSVSPKTVIQRLYYDAQEQKERNQFQTTVIQDELEECTFSPNITRLKVQQLTQKPKGIGKYLVRTLKSRSERSYSPAPAQPKIQRINYAKLRKQLHNDLVNNI